jgi:hypothetical protein
VATVFGFRMEFFFDKICAMWANKNQLSGQKKRTDGDYTQTEDFFNVVNVLELY